MDDIEFSVVLSAFVSLVIDNRTVDGARAAE